MSKYLTKSYGTRHVGKTGDLVQMLTDIRRTCWLEWTSDPKQPRSVSRIGIWGQIWALGVLWSLVAREEGRDSETAPETAKNIIRHGREHEILPETGEFKHEISDIPAATRLLLSDGGEDKIGNNLITTYDDLLQTYLGGRGIQAFHP